MGWAARSKISSGNPLDLWTRHTVQMTKDDRQFVTLRTGAYVRTAAGQPLRRATDAEQRHFVMQRQHAQAIARNTPVKA